MCDKFKISNGMDRKRQIYLLATVGFLVFLNLVFIGAPRNFPKGIVFRVETGSSLRKVSSSLKEAGIIRSRVAFEIFVILYGGENRIQPADYLFEEKIAVLEVARRISKGERHLLPGRVIIPEGFTVEEIADTLESELSSFDRENFFLSARSREGYLFPDTYFFFTNASASDVLQAFAQNYEKKIAPLRKEMEVVGRTESEIIRMASIIEKESSGGEDRALISGILWKRLKIKMPLQADAAPETYQKLGLPESPIANPGLASILAALRPESSLYLYYLHDKDGGIHYARNFSEHQVNIAKFLK